MDRILLLGGNGFIGKNIIENYLKEDCKLVLLHLKNDFVDLHLKANTKISVIEGEIRNLHLIQDIIIRHEINVVIHLVSTLIPSSSVEDYYYDLENVIIPTYRLLDYISKTNVKFVFFSSGGTIYGRSKFKVKEEHRLAPINYYGLSKLLIEDYLRLQSRSSNLRYLILRPSNVYGKFQRLEAAQGFIAVAIGKVLADKPVEIWGDGKAIRDYIYVQDVAEIVLKIIKSGFINETLNIGSGIGTNLLEILEIIQKYFDKEIIKIFKDKRPVDLDKMILDNEKLLSVITFEPVEVERGIQRFMEHLKIRELEK
jgi:UDP-glucose 4-epimerase